MRMLKKTTHTSVTDQFFTLNLPYLTSSVSDFKHFPDKKKTNKRLEGLRTKKWTVHY